MPATLVRVAVVDDNIDGAEAMCEIVADAKFHAEVLSPSGSSLESVANQISSSFDAAVCDHHLRAGQAFSFEGADLAAALYDRKVPAVVHTRWADALEDDLRRTRRRVPILLRMKDYDDPETIRAGLEQCQREFHGEFSPERKPWRTLVRVEEIDRGRTPILVYAVVPEWDADKRVRFPLSLIPNRIVPAVELQKRLFAQVNVGASIVDDLFFMDFEAPDE